MAEHKLTSLKDLMKEPNLSSAAQSESDDDSGEESPPGFTELFGELSFHEKRSSSTKSVWDLFNPPLPLPRSSISSHSTCEGPKADETKEQVVDISGEKPRPKLYPPPRPTLKFSKNGGLISFFKEGEARKLNFALDMVPDGKEGEVEEDAEDTCAAPVGGEDGADADKKEA